ncbi:hypothetical protein D3C72_652580 [compost metagenome]
MLTVTPGRGPFLSVTTPVIGAICAIELLYVMNNVRRIANNCKRICLVKIFSTFNLI